MPCPINERFLSDASNLTISRLSLTNKLIFNAEPCEKTFCAWGAHCVNGPDGRALCQCPTHCPDNVDLVCGTDGKTYKNHCLLRVASCKARLHTRVEYAGECGKINAC